MERSHRWIRTRDVACVLLAVATLVAASCGNARRPVVLGAVYDLTGAQAPLDVPSARGARLAAEQASRAGVLGRPVDLEVVDGRSDPAVVRERTGDLLQRRPETAALLGLSDTDMVLAAAPVAAAAGRVFVTSGATSPLLPADVPTWLFLACFDDDAQAAAAAEWAYESRGARSAVVLYSTADRYTEILQRAFRARFEQQGGVVRAVRAYDPATLDAPAVAGLPAADVIFLAAQPDDAIAATALLRTAGIATPILGGDAFDTDAWRAHPALGDVFFTTHAYLGADSTDPRVRAFRAAFAAAYPGVEPDAFAALGYDATNLLVAAVERAGSDDPEAVRAALAATRDFPGVTGTISYAPGARIPSKPVTILAVEGGARRFVAQVAPRALAAP